MEAAETRPTQMMGFIWTKAKDIKAVMVVIAVNKMGLQVRPMAYATEALLWPVLSNCNLKK